MFYLQYYHSWSLSDTKASNGNYQCIIGLVCTVQIGIFTGCEDLPIAFEKQSSFGFFCNSFRFQPGASESSVQIHLPFQYFLSFKNVPRVRTSTKHLNIQSLCYGTTCMKLESQTHFLKHTTQGL